MPQAQFAVPKQYTIVKDGKFIELTEEEMKAFLLLPEVRKLVLEMQEFRNYAAIELTESKATHATIDDIKMAIESAQVTFPAGYIETHRIESDPKAARKAVFVYAQNPISREYGYRIVSPKGEVSQFNRAGSIYDPKSLIGSFLRSIPKDGKPMIKQDFLKLGLQSVTEGRRLKALIDIAEIEGYLTKKILEDREGRTGYLVTAKLLELGGANVA